MRIIIFLFSFLFGANLINIDSFKNNKSIDILLSLDSAFKGKVLKINDNEYLIKDVYTNGVIQKNFSSPFIQKLLITPSNDGIKLKFISNTKFKIQASLTPGKYGIRFRIIPEIKNQQLPSNNKESFLDYIVYVVIIAILIIFTLLLLLIKKKHIKISGIEAKVKGFKQLDNQNKIVLLEYKDKEYLLILGSSNLLLDTFKLDKSKKNDKLIKNDFEKELNEQLKK